MLAGVGAPSNSVGNNGDLYHRTDAPYQSIYGPKANGAWPSTFSYIVGQGCTTVYHIDKDCDGYGVGPTTITTDPNPLFGPDADDNDPTVNTSTSVLTKYGTISAFLTHLGYPTNRIYYIDANNGNDSNFGTYGCSYTNPCKDWGAIASTMNNGAGGTVIYLPGTSTGINVCNPGACYYPWASSTSSPAVLMSYPGTMANFVGGNNLINGGGGSYNASTNVIFNGFRLISNNPGFGGGITGGWMQNVTFENMEIAGWNEGIETSAGGKHVTITNNLFHDISEHAIYPTTAGQDPSVSVYSPTMLNCATWTWQANGTKYNPNFNLVTSNNNFLFVGSGGFDAVHYNGEVCGGAITGNILVNGGGTPITLQDGDQNVTVSNNLIASNSAAGVTLNIYGCDSDDQGVQSSQIGTSCDTTVSPGIYYYPNGENENSIVNNTIWTGLNAPVSEFCPTGDCNTPYYGINVADTSEGVPGNRVIQNTTIQNNIIVSFNGNQGGSYPQLYLARNSYPETDLLANNLLYNAYTGNSSSDVMTITPNGNCSSAPWYCAGSTTGIYGSGSAYPGTFSFGQFQSYNTSTNSGNVWGNPQFADVQTGYSVTPNMFDFHLLPGSPAIGAGTSVGAPSTDIQGVSRAASPSMGAYEYGGSATSTPTISSFSASPSIVALNGTSTLIFSVSNASSTSISPGIGTVTGSSTTTPALSTTTIYTLTAVNANGATTATATVSVATAPTAPGSLSVTGTTASTTSLSWSASTPNNGSSISFYSIYSGTATSSMPQIATTSALSYTNTGLASSTTYYYYITAKDSVGNNSASSTTASGTTLSGLSPTITSFSAAPAVVALNGTSTLSWTVASATTLSISPTIGTVTGTSTTTPALSTTTLYTLTAVNSNGTTTATTTVQVATAPTAPQTLTGTPANAQVSLSWLAPSSNGGSALTEYIVQESLTASSTFATIATTSTSTLAYVASGLTNGSSYHFQVLAQNSVGTSSPSNTFTATPITVPSAPTGLSATAGNAQATVTFTPGANGGSSILYYTASSTPGGITASSSTTSITVTGLTNGTPYTFKVTATNAAGTSTPSSASNSITPSGLAPAISSFTASPAVIASSSSSALNWITSGAISVSIDNGVGNQSATSTGAVSVSPTSTTVYTLTAANLSGTTTAQTTVTVDTTPPSIPTGLSATAVSQSEIDLSWASSTDNVGVAGYQVFRNGSQIATTTAVSYPDIGLAASTSYSYTVSAFDAAGNISAQATSPSATTQAASSGGGGAGGGGGGGGGVYIPPTPTPTSTPPASPGLGFPPLSSAPLRLIDQSGTFYLIINGQREGITDPGILNSYGFSFSDAHNPTAADLALPQGSLLSPADGALVKSQQDKTVYLISDGQRHAFVSARIFLGLGFKFSSVLLVTNPELQALPLGYTITSSTIAHPDGVNISYRGTVYLIGNGQRRPYPSLAVYNSWNLPNDFSMVIPANAADLNLPVGTLVSARVLQ
jgi:hypothetical protein